MYIRFIGFALFLLLLPIHTANAWGALGHRVTCDLAWRVSSPIIKTQLAAAAKRMGYKTFAESCVWADRIKGQSKYDHLKTLHYMNVEKSATTVVSSSCFKQRAPRCVATAIDHYLSRLRKIKKLSQRERDEALLFVSHFVADIHQPLHVSYADDRGGTQRNVVFEGKLLSLHRLWDSELLYCQAVNGKVVSWRNLGNQLFKRQLASQYHQANVSVHVWANESLSITRQLYRVVEKRLPDTYCERYYPIATEQLELAGVRLAKLLSIALVP